MMKRVLPSIACMLILILLLLGVSNGFAQTPTGADTTDISNMSLEDLMKYKSQGVASELETKINSALEVASITPLAARKSPGIVSIISEEEIRKSGARDLMDILKMVPGVDFGVDVTGVVGIAIRGNWGHEAKVLLQINGMGMNETVYGTLQFANRYPIDQIKRIEIIRGPGSAIYGGEAEYAVINIITKNGQDLNGVQVNANYGTMEHALESNNYTLAIGKKKKDFSFALSNYWGTGNRSDQTYTDVYDGSFDMAKGSQIKPVNFILGLNYKAFSLNACYDRLLLETQDAYDAVLSQAYKQYFTTMIADAKYEWKVSDKFSVTPKISFKRTNPWEITTPGNDTTEDAFMLYKTIADRYKANVTATWNATKNASFTFGTEEFYDIGKKFNGDLFTNSQKEQVTYFNSSAFAQSILKNKIANLTVGARYDHNSSFGGAFVPRVGLTKRIDRLNFKLLYSNSFKAPAIENVEGSFEGTIKPEMTKIWEFETSYQVNKDMFINLNVFDISTQDAIVYFVDTTVSEGADGYINRDKSGSQGFELEYKFIGKWGHMNLGYSFYTAKNKDRVPEYAYPGNDKDILAFANHKLTLNTSFNVSKSVYISPSLLYYSKKYGASGTDSLGEYSYKPYPESLYANLFIGSSKFLAKGLEAGVGVYDIFNQKTIFIQPYQSGHAPLPGASREFLARLTYHFNYK
jgi:outer membrane cobalamin receptor